jgi:hypothetical protein
MRRVQHLSLRRGVHQRVDTIPNRREKTHGPVSRLAEQTRPWFARTLGLRRLNER